MTKPKCCQCQANRRCLRCKCVRNGRECEDCYPSRNIPNTCSNRKELSVSSQPARVANAKVAEHGSSPTSLTFPPVTNMSSSDLTPVESDREVASTLSAPPKETTVVTALPSLSPPFQLQPSERELGSGKCASYPSGSEDDASAVELEAVGSLEAVYDEIVHWRKDFLPYLTTPQGKSLSKSWLSGYKTMSIPKEKTGERCLNLPSFLRSCFKSRP